MQIDYHLIARAEKLYAQNIHKLADTITIYIEGIAIGTAHTLGLAMEAERKLRSMCVEMELANI